MILLKSRPLGKGQVLILQEERSLSIVIVRAWMLKETILPFCYSNRRGKWHAHFKYRISWSSGHGMAQWASSSWWWQFSHRMETCVYCSNRKRHAVVYGSTLVTGWLEFTCYESSSISYKVSTFWPEKQRMLIFKKTFQRARSKWIMLSREKWGARHANYKNAKIFT